MKIIGSFYDILQSPGRYPDPVGSVVTRESHSWRENTVGWLESKGYALAEPTEAQLGRLSRVFSMPSQTT